MRGAARRARQRDAARNLAAWHTSSTAALGLEPRTDSAWWTCAMPAPNVFYSAISVAPATNRRQRAAMLEALAPHARDRSTSIVSVCDSWDQLDLRTFGLHRRTGGRWLHREPTAASPAGRVGAPPGLRIAPVGDLATLASFERTMVAGFGARPPIAPHDIHAPGILDDPAMHVLAGWVDDELVACAMTYVTDVAGIYGVATVPGRRRCGIGAAMATAALDVAPDRPAVLQPTPAAGALYDRLGFVELGTFSHWA